MSTVAGAPLHTPVCVLTHERRAPWERRGGTTFFVVDVGFERASVRLSCCERVSEQDVGSLQLMVGAAMDAGHDIAPDLWRRYLAIMRHGRRAQPARAEPLPPPTVTPQEMDAVLMGACKE